MARRTACSPGEAPRWSIQALPGGGTRVASGDVSLTEFLVARTVEALEASGCEFDRRADGRLTCRCAEPDPAVSAKLDQIDLIYWCDDRRPIGEAFLRLLADGYATHPDYHPEWHRIC